MITDDLDIDDLIKEVAKCDKHLGVKLKKKKAYNEPDEVFEVAAAEAQEYLVSLVCTLNQIDESDYFIEDENTGWMISGPIGVRFKSFREKSCFDWNSDKRYDMHSLIFKIRFLTVYLTEYMCYIDNIAINKFKKTKKAVGIYEHAYFYLRDILNNLRVLVEAMLESNTYGNILLKTVLISNYKKKKDQSKEVNEIIYNSIVSLKEGLSFNLFSGIYLDDDMAIHMILRTAYILATGTKDTSKLPQFDAIEGATVGHNLVGLIEQLGYHIMKRNKKSIFYYSFKKARARIYSDLKDVTDNLYIETGAIAILMVDFLANNQRISRFIYEMLQDGK